MEPGNNDIQAVWVFDLDRVANSKTASALLKLTGQRFKADGYILLSDWLAEVSPDDLRHLIGDAADQLYRGIQTSQSLNTLVMLLATAEGLQVSSREEAVEYVKRFARLIECEAFDRMGLATFHRHLATLSYEVDSAAIIVMKTEFGDEDPDLNEKLRKYDGPPIE